MKDAELRQGRFETLCHMEIARASHAGRSLAYPKWAVGRFLQLPRAVQTHVYHRLASLATLHEQLEGEGYTPV